MDKEKRTILLVDDEQEFSQMVKHGLERSGDFSVLWAGGGKLGVKWAIKFKPALILLDIVMPDMDGFAVLEQLKNREDTMAIPVFMLSAINTQEAKQTTSSLYSEGYIAKPVDMEHLIKTISMFLADKNPVKS
jgi:DNA-binding response OmpR family regulator